MIQYTEESNGVFSLPLYEAKLCRSIVNSLKRLRDWSAAEIRLETGPGQYGSFTRLDTRSARILTSSRAEQLHQQFDMRIDKVINPFIKHVWGVDLPEHSGTQILRYPPGGHYIVHQDAGADLRDRYFTVVCYLNDDFEGGDTWFPSLNYSAIPKTGKAIVFPAEFWHCAQPVIRGEKYVIVSWIQGPVPINWV